ncbi:MAG: putative ABC transporter-binding protein [Anaerolineales bacterium]|nr:putative ABC transporter-binding protein [Anaerolineales bacterium]
MKSKLLVLLTVLSILTVLGVACAAPAPAPVEQPEEAAPAEESAPPAEEAGEAAFVGAWPYQVPPTGHFNSYVTNALVLGIYRDLMEQPLAMYRWADGSWMPLLATDWELVPPDTFTLNLREGVTWSDGSGFTAQDVISTFTLGRVMGWTVWQYVDEIEAPDDHTVSFHMAVPSTVVPRYVLRQAIVADSVYGEFAEKAQAIFDEGKGRDSDEMQALRQEFEAFRPGEMVVSGPFKVDPDSITESQLTLVKVPTAWNADQVGFDKVVLYNGETPTITPVVLAKEIDYATHGFPPATEAQFESEGIRVLRPPIFTGPALYVNHDIYPLNVKKVRQAIAYAINRDENATVSLDESAIRQQYMVGFSDNLAPLWISEADLGKLNPYEYDPAKAEEMFKDVGFTKADDGVWVDDEGNRMEFELTAPAEFADWSAAAENLAEQLTKFGIKTTVRGITFTQHPTDVRQGKFELAIREWGAGHPHPHFSYVTNFFSYNFVSAPTPGSTAPQSAAGPGMNYPLEQDTEVMGEVDLAALVVRAADGLDEAAQKEKVTEIALVYNELLPQIPLWERYGNNPTPPGVRVTGWPSDDAPIMQNSPYADSFVIMMILDGTLQPPE